jgi:ABC-type polysaccharide transport system permease subunit
MTYYFNMHSWAQISHGGSAPIHFALFSSSGMINHLLLALGLVDRPITRLCSDSHTWLSMCLLRIGKSLGWNAILYLAAMAGINPQLCEAGRHKPQRLPPNNSWIHVPRSMNGPFAAIP